MTEQQKQEILTRAKNFFREKIAPNHVKNTKKCAALEEFNINPFLDNYLACFAFGCDSPENLAKALIYPRALGTSITTSFGMNWQKFCSSVLEGFASTTSGIDIEFVDALDGRRKYCQIKSGPNTINFDDVTTIVNHFIAIRRLARTNNLEGFNPDRDCVVGVFYGNESELSSFYKKIAESYPVLVGKNFWHRLTGDENFYNELIDAVTEVALEIDGTETINSTVSRLAEQIRRRRN